jgi:hypothetical protein
MASERRGREQTSRTGPKMAWAERGKGKRNFQKPFSVKRNILEIAG